MTDTDDLITCESCHVGTSRVTLAESVIDLLVLLRAYRDLLDRMEIHGYDAEVQALSDRLVILDARLS